jgi:hypothetical protein
VLKVTDKEVIVHLRRKGMCAYRMSGPTGSAPGTD